MTVGKKDDVSVVYQPVTQGAYKIVAESVKVAKQLTYKIVAESVKIITVTLFLDFLRRCFLKEPNRVYREKIILITVFAPFAEEILFRGFLLRGINACQFLIQKYQDRNLTAEQKKFQHIFCSSLKIQKIFRIHLSALIFAAAHLANPHPNAISASIQFTWAYLGGVAYGELSEKYRTLSLSILAHGINNTLAVAIGLYPQKCVPIVAAIFVNKISAYVLAVTTLDAVVSQFRKLRAFCCHLPDRACV